MDLSNSAINKIGDIIRQGKNTDEYEDSVAILNTWRESHGKILDEFYDKCVNLAERIDKNNIIVAQRLKRLPTIIGKLNRFKNMRLSSMQDIAGVRIIVNDIEQLSEIEKRIKKWHNLVKISDYINKPKPSGYRGKHFIFKKDGMFVEIQLRTNLQHLWATSVETTDIFRGASLKEKDDNTYWHNFFCQVSSIFALSENANPVSEYKGLSLKELCGVLEKNMRLHRINSQIASFALTEPIVADQRIKNAYYIVISLDFKKKEATTTKYKESEYHQAFQDYKKLEQMSAANKQTVLIAVNQIKKIREAYPNYFMSLSAFLDIITFILANNAKKG
ncbi:RelA/SpoT domain-containing protein [Candidatus Saccharibacteria bacterium]|nr:RelA/SpoT domain-containing protein [Candidatus Saccharibacteria bacterium]